VLCHGCGAKYRNIYNLLRDLGADLDGLRERPPQDIDEIFALFRNSVESVEGVEDCRHLPVEFKRIYPGMKDELARCMYHYLHTRGVTDQQIEDYAVGYCEDGRYADMVVIPVYQDDKLLFFTTRRVFGAGKKTLNPKAGDSKRYVLMGYDRCYEASPDKIYIVEGPFDLWALEAAGFYGVAVMGSTITPDQAALLSKIDAELIVCFDPDAEEKTRKYAAVLAKNCPNTVSVCIMSGDDDLSDLCERGEKGLAKIRRILSKTEELDLASQLENIFLATDDHF
jgi:DNA primase